MKYYLEMSELTVYLSFYLILNCEHIYHKYQNYTVHNNTIVAIDKICIDINIKFPS